MARLSFLLLVLAGCGANNTFAGSTFDANDEGWALSGDAEGKVELRAVGGSPGGHICGKDSTNGDVWYFVAPAPFLGDKSKVYGKSLSWALKQDQMYQQLSGRDVIIQGMGTTLIYNIKATPGRSWTTYDVNLDALPNSGWRLDQPGGGNPETFPLATKEDMEAVFKNITALRFRGEFTDGPDSACLDNVFLGSQ